MTTTYTIQAQHPTPSGWQPCPDHLAQRWAVTQLKRKGKLTVTRTVASFRTKVEAQASAETFTRLGKPARKLKLGGRCPPPLPDFLATSDPNRIRG